MEQQFEQLHQLQVNLNKFLENKDILVFGGSELRNKKQYALFSHIIGYLHKHWNKDFSNEEREIIARIIMKTNRNYIGDTKWVLYQYICDIGSDNVTIRCGNYAYNKLIQSSYEGSNLQKNKSQKKNINGEEVIIIHVPELNKKQLIISKEFNLATSNELIRVYPEDIILHFA